MTPNLRAPAMDFYALVDLVANLLQQRGKVTYR